MKSQHSHRIQHQHKKRSKGGALGKPPAHVRTLSTSYSLQALDNYIPNSLSISHRSNSDHAISRRVRVSNQYGQRHTIASSQSKRCLTPHQTRYFSNQASSNGLDLNFDFLTKLNEPPAPSTSPFDLNHLLNPSMPNQRVHSPSGQPSTPDSTTQFQPGDTAASTTKPITAATSNTTTVPQKDIIPDVSMQPIRHTAQEHTDKIKFRSYRHHQQARQIKQDYITLDGGDNIARKKDIFIAPVKWNMFQSHPLTLTKRKAIVSKYLEDLAERQKQTISPTSPTDGQQQQPRIFEPIESVICTIFEKSVGGPSLPRDSHLLQRKKEIPSKKTIKDRLPPSTPHVADDNILSSSNTSDDDYFSLLSSSYENVPYVSSQVLRLGIQNPQLLKDDNGIPLLYYAISQKKSEITRLLLSLSHTPVHWTVGAGPVSMFGLHSDFKTFRELFLSGNASFNPTPLLPYVVHHADSKMLDLLLSNNILNINSRDKNGNTMLMLACADLRKQKKSVEELEQEDIQHHSFPEIDTDDLIDFGSTLEAQSRPHQSHMDLLLADIDRILDHREQKQWQFEQDWASILEDVSDISGDSHLISSIQQISIAQRKQFIHDLRELETFSQSIIQETSRKHKKQQNDLVLDQDHIQYLRTLPYIMYLLDHPNLSTAIEPDEPDSTKHTTTTTTTPHPSGLTQTQYEFLTNLIQSIHSRVLHRQLEQEIHQSDADQDDELLSQDFEKLFAEVGMDLDSSLSSPDDGPTSLHPLAETNITTATSLAEASASPKSIPGFPTGVSLKPKFIDIYDHSIVDLLLSYGADPFLKNPKGQNSFYFLGKQRIPSYRTLLHRKLTLASRRF